jgi:rhodanese-related sulfurtransferase
MEWEKYWIIPNTDKFIIFWWPSFESEIQRLDKTKKYLLYCFHWNRSDVARNYMKQLWFTRVKDLAWWINAWYKVWERIWKKEN